jgi:hypothetical protein
MGHFFSSCFGDEGVYHTIVPTWSASEVETAMGNLCAEARFCDCFGAQLKAPAKVFQLRLAHQPRDLQRALEADPQGEWAREMQELFRSAIHFAQSVYEWARRNDAQRLSGARDPD